MKKQDNILQKKKNLEIIEKIDFKKVYNVLKEDYLKGKKYLGDITSNFHQMQRNIVLCMQIMI